MKTTRIIATVAFAAIAILTTNADAQSVGTDVQAQVVQPQVIPGPGQVIGGPIETRVIEQPVIAPPPAPKLGFTGQMIYGLGMKVLSVNYGSPAQRAGLEHGDIIMSANGVLVNSHADLSRALSNAVQYTNGSVSLYVKNIRGTAWQGNEYVTVTAQLFGQPMPSAAVVSNPVVHN